MTTFVLVHGAWHGAWCWERLVPELETRGHSAITMDLPSDDPAATFETYADVIVETMRDSHTPDIVLVGHSLAGLTVPLVAARHPVRRLVYLCALPAIPGLSLVDQMGTEKMLNMGYVAGMSDVDSKGRRAWIDEDLARRIMYADCDDEAAEGAIARLRPQAQSPYAIPCPLDNYPDVPTTYIVCSEDRLVNPEWSREFALTRLGAELIELPGSHSPFMSRPADLAATLEGTIHH
ncbi:MAG: alpha/beta fold hydrolase [Aeromicrobium sp.]